MKIEQMEKAIKVKGELEYKIRKLKESKDDLSRKIIVLARKDAEMKCGDYYSKVDLEMYKGLVSTQIEKEIISVESQIQYAESRLNNYLLQHFS
jgi:hypothetical protein